MNYWIFQSVPDRYDLRDESNLKAGLDHWWYATRNRNQMAPGDVVYFWMGGDKEIRGLYGAGTITSIPYEEDGDFKVKVHISDRFSQHISVNKIKDSPDLKNLMILKIAVGSNFLISKKEGLAINALMKKLLVPVGANHG